MHELDAHLPQFAATSVGLVRLAVVLDVPTRARRLRNIWLRHPDARRLHTMDEPERQRERQRVVRQHEPVDAEPGEPLGRVARLDDPARLLVLHTSDTLRLLDGAVQAAGGTCVSEMRGPVLRVRGVPSVAAPFRFALANLAFSYLSGVRTRAPERAL